LTVVAAIAGFFDPAFSTVVAQPNKVAPATIMTAIRV
jgi:hypothetical protein